LPLRFLRSRKTVVHGCNADPDLDFRGF
jgi:hypothetical protein